MSQTVAFSRRNSHRISLPNNSRASFSSGYAEAAIVSIGIFCQHVFASSGNIAGAAVSLVVITAKLDHRMKGTIRFRYSNGWLPLARLPPETNGQDFACLAMLLGCLCRWNMQRGTTISERPRLSGRNQPSKIASGSDQIGPVRESLP